jgi:hypothetical protein
MEFQFCAAGALAASVVSERSKLTAIPAPVQAETRHILQELVGKVKWKLFNLPLIFL